MCIRDRDFRLTRLGERAEQPGDLGHFADGGAAQGQAVALDQNGQVPLIDIQALAELAPLLALKIDQLVRNAVLVQEIVELMPIRRAGGGHDAEPGKFRVALHPLARCV